MTLLLYTIILAFSYALFVGFSLVNLIIGFGVSLGILWFLPQLPAPQSNLIPDTKDGKKFVYFMRNIIKFLIDFCWDLTLSNLYIAWDVWTPKDHYFPKLVHVPIEDLTELEVMLLSSRITLTPGTLSVDVTEDRKSLIVHVMYPSSDTIEKDLRKPIDMLKKDI